MIMIKNSVKIQPKSLGILGNFCVTWVTYLKGLFLIQQVTGMVQSKNSEVEESTGRADVQIEREESTLNKAVGVSV